MDASKLSFSQQPMSGNNNNIGNGGGGAALLVDGDYFVTGLDLRTMLTAADVEELLIRRITSSSLGEGDVSIRVCFFTDHVLQAAGFRDSALISRFLSTMKACRFQCVIHAGYGRVERATDSAVEAHLVVKSMQLAAKFPRLTTFVIFAREGAYTSMFEHFSASEGKQVVIMAYEGDTLYDLVDWSPFIAMVGGKDASGNEGGGGVLRIRRRATALQSLSFGGGGSGGNSTIMPEKRPGGHQRDSLPLAALIGHNNMMGLFGGGDAPASGGSEGPSTGMSMARAPPTLPGGGENPFDDFFATPPASSSSPATQLRQEGLAVANQTSNASAPYSYNPPASQEQQQQQHQQGPSSTAEPVAASSTSSPSPTTTFRNVSEQTQIATTTTSEPPSSSSASPQQQQHQVGVPTASSSTGVASQEQQQQQQQSSSTEPQPIVVTPLPAGCSIHFDSRYRRHYYMVPDKASGGSTCQWEHPLGPQEQYKVEQQVFEWYEQQKEKKMQPQQQHHHHHHSSIPSPQRAPPQQVQQELRTNITVRPASLPQQQQQQQNPQGSPPLGGGSGAQSQTPPLPGGWTCVYDPAMLRMVYIHKDSGVRSLEFPSQPKPSLPSTPVAAVVPQTTAQPQQQLPLPLSSTVPPSQWFSRVDPATGRTFYANPATRETCWTLPPNASIVAESRQPQLPPQQQQLQQAMNIPGQAVLPTLPTITTAVVPQQQQLQQLQPQALPVPAAVATTPQPLPQQQQQPQLTVTPAPVNAVRLPAGWQACTDPATGKTFYVDHNTKKTTWTPPPF